MMSECEMMQQAICEAESAAAGGDVPVGAVIVKDGEIIARAHNSIEAERYSSAHAEMSAIREAEQSLGSKWLTGCSMYVTLEPCTMCAGAIVLARISDLYVGADDPKTGACGSLRDVVRDQRLNHMVNVHTGIEKERCSELLRNFFRKRREENRRLKESRSLQNNQNSDGGEV